MTNAATKEKAHSRRIVDAVLDPANLPPSAASWATDDGAKIAADLLTRALGHLDSAHRRAHAARVPAALERITMRLEDAGMSPATALKVAEDIRRDLHVLVADLTTDAKTSLHRRLALDFAANLVPQLDRRPMP